MWVQRLVILKSFKLVISASHPFRDCTSFFMSSPMVFCCAPVNFGNLYLVSKILPSNISRGMTLVVSDVHV